MLFAQSALPTGPSTFLEEREKEQAQIAAELSGLDYVPEEYFPATAPVSGDYTFSRGYTSDELAFDEALLEPTFAYAVTPTTVSFTWASNSEAKRYLVLRDGVKIVETTGTSFAEDGLSSGAQYRYELIGVDVNGDTISSRMMPVQTLSNNKAASDKGGVVVPMTYQPYTTAFTYKTFIADQYVPLDWYVAFSCGQWFDTSRSFGGDDRSWAPPTFAAPYETPHYRTMLFANVNWDNPAPYDVILAGGIGQSKLYDSSHTVIETKTADFSNTNLIDTYKAGAYAQTHWQHSVGNPFCAVGAITYDVVVRFYRSGSIEVVGDREPVPHHEGYGRWDSGSGEFWDAMFQRTNEGFDCLVGYCTDDPIIVSETH